MTILQHNSLRKVLLLALLVTLTALAGVTTPPATAAASDCIECDIEYEMCLNDCFGHGHLFCVQECNFYYENCLEFFC